MKKRLLITLLVLVGIVLGPYLIGVAADCLFSGGSLANVSVLLIWAVGLGFASGLIVIGALVEHFVRSIPDLIRWIKTGK